FDAFAIAAAMQHKLRQQTAHKLAVNVNPELLEWASTAHLRTVEKYDPLGETSDTDGTIHVQVIRPGHYRVEGAGQEAEVELLSITEDTAKLRVNGRTVTAIYHAHGRNLHLALEKRSLSVTDMTGL